MPESSTNLLEIYSVYVPDVCEEVHSNGSPAFLKFACFPPFISALSVTLVMAPITYNSHDGFAPANPDSRMFFRDTFQVIKFSLFTR